MTLRARCIELIRSNPAFTRADVEALVRAWDEERGKQREVADHRVIQLVYLAQNRMGLPRRLPAASPPKAKPPWSPAKPPIESAPTTAPPASEEERQLQLTFFLDVQRRWVNARTSKEFVRWLEGEILRALNERVQRFG